MRLTSKGFNENSVPLFVSEDTGETFGIIEDAGGTHVLFEPFIGPEGFTQYERTEYVKSEFSSEKAIVIAYERL